MYASHAPKKLAQLFTNITASLRTSKNSFGGEADKVAVGLEPFFERRAAPAGWKIQTKLYFFYTKPIPPKKKAFKISPEKWDDAKRSWFPHSIQWLMSHKFENNIEHPSSSINKLEGQGFPRVWLLKKHTGFLYFRVQTCCHQSVSKSLTDKICLQRWHSSLIGLISCCDEQTQNIFQKLFPLPENPATFGVLSST